MDQTASFIQASAHVIGVDYYWASIPLLLESIILLRKRLDAIL